MQLRCIACGVAFEAGSPCSGCGRAYAVVDGVTHAIRPLRGNNRIAAEFYDGPHWERFRPLERRFLDLHGGQQAARRQILRFLPRRSAEPLQVLEVGVGDGENLALLPPSWRVAAVDVSRVQLAACRDRFAAQPPALFWAEAEQLPFAAGQFDAVFSVGGFNYFRDHAQALAEMRRVARPGAPLVVADEVPGLRRLLLGHLIGLPRLDVLSLRAAGLSREFARMAADCYLDIDRLRARHLPHAARVPIWHRLGYCLVDPAPDRRTIPSLPEPTS